MRGDIVALAKSFHVLLNADGLSPWEPHKFREWVEHSIRGRSAWLAGQFVFGVWSGQSQFDLFEALARWDIDNKAAFKAWATDPWFA